MEWLTDHQWQAWFALALTLGVAEVVSLDLVLVMLAAGAAAGGLTALATDQVWVQVAVALAVSVAMLAVFRPMAKRRLLAGPDLVLGHSKLVGRPGVVLIDISVDVPGQVKVDGETWTALPYDESLQIAAGQSVEVLEIRGATAYVHPVARLAP